MTNITARISRSFDEEFSYPPSPFLEEESAPLGHGWRLLIVAVLSSVLGFVGLEVANSHAPVALTQAVVSSGAQTMSATELVQGVKAENLSAYWINAKVGDSYTNNGLTDGVDQISYRPEGSDISNLNQFDVMIETYRDFATYDSHPHPLNSPTSQAINLRNGATLTVDQTSSNRAVVVFSQRPEIVVLNYPTPQPVLKLISDAQSLVPIN